MILNEASMQVVTDDPELASALIQWLKTRGVVRKNEDGTERLETPEELNERCNEVTGMTRQHGRGSGLVLTTYLCPVCGNAAADEDGDGKVTCELGHTFNAPTPGGTEMDPIPGAGWATETSAKDRGQSGFAVYTQYGHTKGSTIWYMAPGGKLHTQTQNEPWDQHDAGDPSLGEQEGKSIAVGRVDHEKNVVTIRTPVSGKFETDRMEPARIRYVAKKLRKKYPDHKILYFDRHTPGDPVDEDDTASHRQLRANPNAYRQAVGKCPPGYHYGSNARTCVPNRTVGSIVRHVGRDIARGVRSLKHTHGRERALHQTGHILKHTGKEIAGLALLPYHAAKGALQLAIKPKVRQALAGKFLHVVKQESKETAAMVGTLAKLATGQKTTHEEHVAAANQAVDLVKLAAASTIVGHWAAGGLAELAKELAMPWDDLAGSLVDKPLRALTNRYLGTGNIHGLLPSAFYSKPSESVNEVYPKASKAQAMAAVKKMGAAMMDDGHELEVFAPAGKCLPTGDHYTIYAYVEMRWKQEAYAEIVKEMSQGKLTDCDEPDCGMCRSHKGILAAGGKFVVPFPDGTESVDEADVDESQDHDTASQVLTSIASILAGHRPTIADLSDALKGKVPDDKLQAFLTQAKAKHLAESQADEMVDYVICDMDEMSMSRIVHHTQAGNGFVVLSPDRSERTNQENREHRKALLQHLRSMGKGYTHVKGGYVEQTPKGPKSVYEHSIMVHNVSHDEAKELAKHAFKHHQQEAVLHVHPPTGAHLHYGQTGKKEHVGDDLTTHTAGSYFTQWHKKRFGFKSKLAASVGMESEDGLEESPDDSVWHDWVIKDWEPDLYIPIRPEDDDTASLDEDKDVTHHVLNADQTGGRMSKEFAHQHFPVGAKLHVQLNKDHHDLHVTGYGRKAGKEGVIPKFSVEGNGIGVERKKEINMKDLAFHVSLQKSLDNKTHVHHVSGGVAEAKTESISIQPPHGQATELQVTHTTDPDEIYAMYKNRGNIRGIVSSAGSKAVWWDANESTHPTVADAMNITGNDVDYIHLTKDSSGHLWLTTANSPSGRGRNGVPLPPLAKKLHAMESVEEAKHPDEPKTGHEVPEHGMQGKSPDGHEYHFGRAKYAKGMMTFHTKNETGFKNRLDRLAGAVSSRYTNRESAHVMSPSQATRLHRLIHHNWDASSFDKKLNPPEKQPEAGTGQNVHHLDSADDHHELKGYYAPLTHTMHKTKAGYAVVLPKHKRIHRYTQENGRLKFAGEGYHDEHSPKPDESSDTASPPTAQDAPQAAPVESTAPDASESTQSIGTWLKTSQGHVFASDQPVVTLADGQKDTFKTILEGTLEFNGWVLDRDRTFKSWRHPGVSCFVESKSATFNGPDARVVKARKELFTGTPLEEAEQDPDAPDFVQADVQQFFDMLILAGDTTDEAKGKTKRKFHLKVLEVTPTLKIKSPELSDPKTDLDTTFPDADGNPDFDANPLPPDGPDHYADDSEQSAQPPAE